MARPVKLNYCLQTKCLQSAFFAHTNSSLSINSNFCCMVFSFCSILERALFHRLCALCCRDGASGAGHQLHSLKTSRRTMCRFPPLVEVPEQSWGLWKGLCSTDSTHFAVSMKPMETDDNSAHSTASMQPEESCTGFHSLVIMLKVTKQKPTNS